MTYISPMLKVSSRKTVEGTVIEAIGELDMTTVNVLEAPLMEGVQAAIDSSEGASLSIDLRRTSFIDSAGLSLLVAARKRLAPAQRFLQILVTPSQQPERVLKLGRFDTIMTIVALSYEGDD